MNKFVIRSALDSSLTSLGCAAQRECAIGRRYRFATKTTGPHASTNLREEALVGPIDTNVSIDVIVQWTCLLASGWNLTLNGLASDRVVGPGSHRDTLVRQQNAANDTTRLQR
jgi:hypothetical protein